MNKIRVLRKLGSKLNEEESYSMNMNSAFGGYGNSSIIDYYDRKRISILKVLDLSNEEIKEAINKFGKKEVEFFSEEKLAYGAVPKAYQELIPFMF